LNYTGSDDVTVSSLATTKGALTIATTGSITVSPASTLNAVGGNLTLRTTDTLAAHTLSIGNGSQLLTTNGSITIENDGLSNAGAITVGSNVLMHASATAKGVGQVSIVMGAVPAAATLAPGATPAANPPVILSSGGATVTYGTAPGNTSGSITINGAGVVLNAAGRNVVFNTGAGNTSSIVLQGNDTITADPPVGAASSATTSSPSSAAIMPAVFATPAASAFASPSGVSAIALPSISSTNTVSSTVALTGPAFSVAPLSANQSVAPAISNLAAINGSESVSLSSSTASANHKPLNGGVSNTAERSLQKGSMFVAPDVDTVIQTGFGSVNVAAGSVALVVAFDGGVAVYNLHDSKRDSVVVSGNGHNVSVVPGRNAILTTRNVHYFEEVNPAEFVGYRRLTSTAFGDGVKAFQSEFDIRTMLMGVEPLKQLVRAEDAHSRKVSGSLLKTAAILMTISDTTPYERMVAPRMTAMNQ
ncbi:MAG: hypothetical protein KGS72_24785, partial [Cyanobacteria bacterium REEB67]|nr:hypothetical protein [Cyanobacteria bacterium REEB67]